MLLWMLLLIYLKVFYFTHFHSKGSLFSMIRVFSKQKSALKILYINQFKYLFKTATVDIISVSEKWFPFNIYNYLISLAFCSSVVTV